MNILHRRDFLRGAGLAGASAILGGCSAFRPGGRGLRPNILFVLIDDLGWADLGCYGNRFHETPHIDRLAAQGMRFTDAYAACPVCSPTRASILSGQYPARTGVIDFIPGHWRPYEKLRAAVNRQQYLPLESVTIAEALKSAGYATGMIGKWHLGREPRTPGNQGFDFVRTGGRNQRDKRVTSFTDHALEFIERHRDRPFFLYLSHHTVHIPLEAPQELVDKYESKPAPSGGVNNPVYAAMIGHLDRSIGRLLAGLDGQGLAENTLVCFFSDNGGLRRHYQETGPIVTSNAPLRDEKGTLYEGGIRVPLIVRWPGVVRTGTTCRAPVTSVDFYPTWLDVAAAPRPAGHVLDGESMLGLLLGQRDHGDRALYWHYPVYHHSTPAGAMRQGPWKLIEFFENGAMELYNLEDDIGEQRDLAEVRPGTAGRLRDMLAAWRESVNADMPSANAHFDPARRHEWGRHPDRE